MQFVLIAAVADNGVIGHAGGMPWRLKADLARFRVRTMNRPVVMGRRTYDSIGKPLAGRATIVVTRDQSLAIPRALVAPNLAFALEAARGEALRCSVHEIMIAGGADIYTQAMAFADRLDITHVKARPEGDTFFPQIDPAVWCEIERTDAPHEDNAPAFAWVNYKRWGDGRAVRGAH
jgi:dihydrofolate reductase